MLSTRDIQGIVVLGKKEFDRLHKVDCDFDLVNESTFWDVAKKSKLIQFEISNHLSVKVGSLTIHGKKDIVLLSKDVLNQLGIDKEGVKALVIHELYHVLNKKKVRNTFKCCVDSEDSVDSLFYEEFPELAKKFDSLRS